MKLRIILFILCCFISINKLKAWDTTAAKFYPLNTGNIYIFEKVDLWFSCVPHEVQAIHKVVITDQVTKPNGKKYYNFSGWWNIPSVNWKYQRIDSSTMNVYWYDSTTNTERLIDSLTATANSYFKCNRLSSVQPFGWFESQSQVNVFNAQRTQRQLQCSGPMIAGTYYYLLEGIGFTGYSICELGYGEQYRLKGCVVRGTVYGDTTLTSVTTTSSTVPGDYQLSQNYPNPFNPVTKISFDIPQLNNSDNTVRLVIYDVMGKEVTTLLNESLTSGSYEILFDASGLTSGVYYYNLTSGNFSQTRKMLLLK